MVAIVEQEDVDVAEARAAEDSRRFGQAVTRIRPIASKQRECFALHRIRQVRVVRAVIVIVPDRDMRGRR